MSSFITNLFPSAQAGKHDNILPVPPPPLHTRSSQNESLGDRPSTPVNRSNFINPVSTPQGSPSKNRNPPGANELPTAFDTAMKLTPANLSSPTKTGRVPIGNPLTPGKGPNANAVDEYFNNSTGNTDESIIQKSSVPSGSPVRRQGKENNTPQAARQPDSPTLNPATIPRDAPSLNQAAISRQELYQTREIPAPPTRKYNTQRGLTAEELEILHKPNVKRLANVTQLCEYSSWRVMALLTMSRFSRLLL